MQVCSCMKAEINKANINAKNAVYTYVNGNIVHLKQQISEDVRFLVVLHVDIHRQCALPPKSQF